jgi:phage protein D
MADDLFYRVSINAGAAQHDLSQELSSLTIEEASARPDQLTVNVSDPDKVLSHALQEGMSVEVELGTVAEHSLMFRGRIYKVDGEFPRDGVPTLRVLAHDASMAMGLRRRSRAWTDMTLSDIVNAVAGAYFSPANISVNLPSGGDHRFEGNGIRQRDQTDLQFLHALARRFGCEMRVVPELGGDKLHFEAQYHIMSATPRVTLYHGRCDTAARLLSFQASSNVGDIQLPRVLSGMEYETGQPTQVTTTTVQPVGSTDDEFADENLSAFGERQPERAARLEALMSAATAVQQSLRQELGGAERRPVAAFTTPQELSAIAANQFSTSIHGMRASGSAYGNQQIHAAANIGIADVGGRFSGTWYVSEARHALSAEGYRTEIQCQR